VKDPLKTCAAVSALATSFRNALLGLCQKTLTFTARRLEITISIPDLCSYTAAKRTIEDMQQETSVPVGAQVSDKPAQPGEASSQDIMNAVQSNVDAATNQVAAQSNGTVVPGSATGFSAEPTSADSSPSSQAPPSGLSVGAWVGIGIAIFLVIIIIVAIVIVMKLKRSSEERV